MKIHISEKYIAHQEKISGLIKSFENAGEAITPGVRNQIKIFQLAGQQINIKSFKVPNFINQVAYKVFRRSKAERSFIYAEHLIAIQIGTPQPIAYALTNTSLFFKDSYYISEHLPYDLTFRELVKEPEFPNHEKILRAFTRFTFKLHENQIEFLDHSPGNTLIQLKDQAYEFFLVDLNRMNFKEMNFEERMKNFSRLTPKREMVEIMADEYSKLINKNNSDVFEKMWFYTNKFQESHLRKKRIKKKFKL
ncbi:lipopolysaccharide kinase InaA family protein [Gillisia sp. CAL575]|uniref:lipopolysaccharide kinase InaA family protein n=1 Tax=Gillisia sp. CAL575 TaxID=985255 RepID=UPI0003A2F1EC|nr:lipopolysaccharide kinase InaA family protein [Gillisia sp. CAL575]